MKKKDKIFIAIGIIVAFTGFSVCRNVQAAFPYSATKTMTTGSTILAADINTSNSDHINNNIPESIDDYSANAAEMRSTRDPYPGASISLAETLDDELQGLRYVIQQITQETYWNIDPPTFCENSASYAHGANDFTVDTSVLKVDSTNDRVGVGIAAPANTLQVVETSSGAATIPLLLTNRASADSTSVAIGFGSIGDDTVLSKIANTRIGAGDYDLSLWNWNGSALAQRLTVDIDGFVAIGTTAPTAQIHVDQASSSGAVPVMTIDQGDIDDTFINFAGTSAADGTRSISSDTTEDSAKFGAIRIEINGTTKWIRIYDDES